MYCSYVLKVVRVLSKLICRALKSSAASNTYRFSDHEKFEYGTTGNSVLRVFCWVCEVSRLDVALLSNVRNASRERPTSKRLKSGDCAAEGP